MPYSLTIPYRNLHNRFKVLEYLFKSYGGGDKVGEYKIYYMRLRISLYLQESKTQCFLSVEEVTLVNTEKAVCEDPTFRRMPKGIPLM